MLMRLCCLNRLIVVCRHPFAPLWSYTKNEDYYLIMHEFPAMIDRLAFIYILGINLSRIYLLALSQELNPRVIPSRFWSAFPCTHFRNFDKLNRKRNLIWCLGSNSSPLNQIDFGKPAQNWFQKLAINSRFVATISLKIILLLKSCFQSYVVRHLFKTSAKLLEK